MSGIIVIRHKSIMIIILTTSCITAHTLMQVTTINPLLLTLLMSNVINNLFLSSKVMRMQIRLHHCGNYFWCEPVKSLPFHHRISKEGHKNLQLQHPPQHQHPKTTAASQLIFTSVKINRNMSKLYPRSTYPCLRVATHIKICHKPKELV